ncbi:MAG: IS6 family transposase, partial [Flavobacteriaceae bacterium]|nr:IS6 family transposase [Flavobacteriaceae bacterium]
VAYSLSYRNIEELLAERSIAVDHATINRWVVKYSPQLAARFMKKRKHIAASWRMDETYIKVKGKWMYQYRAVDKEGNTVDCYFSKKRDKKVAIKFFMKSIKSSRKPIKINIDKSGSNNVAFKDINKGLRKSQRIEISQCKYLNNIVEQDHRFIKKITKPTLGFKSYHSAAATLDGIELHHMLRKNQIKNSANKSIFEQFYDL